MLNLREREHDRDMVKKLAVLLTQICMELGVRVKKAAQVAS